MKYTPSRSAATLAVALSCLIGGAVAASAATSGSDRATSSLSLKAVLSLKSTIGGCPPGPGADDCAAREITGPFPGLGQVAGAYAFLVDLGLPACDGFSGRALAYPIRITVASKGEIELAVAESPCVDTESLRRQAQTFTVTGGTGAYAGASGSGTLERVLGQDVCTADSCSRYGYETWAGTITVPGLAFDVTRPTFSGASSKTVKAKRGAKSARVAFRVTAEDDRDGSLPVTCRPRPGSRFPIGRTKVTCEATDSSANTAAATFTVTVKRPR